MSIISKANILQDYENAVMETYKSYSAQSENTFPFTELGNTSIGGLPLIVQRHGTQLYETFTEDTHALVIGATRSGKTTSYIIPAIFSKACQKRKDSMLITDPKGELYSKCAAVLREQGYKIILLNFRDYQHSECWNPLTPIFRKYQKAIHINEDITAIKSVGEYYNEFKGKIFKNQKSLTEEVNREQQLIFDDAANDIDCLACNIMPTLNTKEPYWEDCARQYFTAFIYAMLEDSVPSEKNINPITEDNFSFRTMLNIMGSFTYGMDDGGDGGYFTSRDKNSKAYLLAKEPIIANAPNTRACIISSFNSKLGIYREVVSNLITSCNTFEMDELVSSDQPVAVFISYRDEVKVSYYVIQQFITAAYTKLIEIANQKNELKLERPFYFILDEFGNFPRIKDFETTISACGGRNIWFVLVLQSYSQLYNVYDRNVGEIIKDNLNMHIFLGTNNPETKKAFSDECGYRTIISPLSALNGQGQTQSHFDRDNVPLIPVSKLNHFETGECVITRTNAKAVLWSKLERSYLCPEFQTELTDAKQYKANVDFSDKKYLYELPQKKQSRFSDFDF